MTLRINFLRRKFVLIEGRIELRLNRGIRSGRSRSRRQNPTGVRQRIHHGRRRLKRRTSDHRMRDARRNRANRRTVSMTDKLFTQASTQGGYAKLLRILHRILQIRRRHYVRRTRRGSPYDRRRSIRQLPQDSHLHSILRPARTFQLARPKTRKHQRRRSATNRGHKGRAHRIRLRQRVTNLHYGRLTTLLTLNMVRHSTALTALSRRRRHSSHRNRRTSTSRNRSISIALANELRELASNTQRTYGSADRSRRQSTITSATLNSLLTRPRRRRNADRRNNSDRRMRTRIIKRNCTLTTRTGKRTSNLSRYRSCDAMTNMLTSLTAPELALFLRLLRLQTSDNRRLRSSQDQSMQRSPRYGSARTLRHTTKGRIRRTGGNPLILPRRYHRTVKISTQG